MTLVLGKKEKKLIFIVGVVAVGALIAPGVLGNYTFQYQNEKLQLKNSLVKKRGKIERDLGGIEDQKEILRRYINRYKTLVERDVIEPMDTVEVVKQMKIIGAERKLGATSFKFENKVEFSPSTSTYTAESSVGVDVYPMILEMGMLHDMDMFMLLESLSGRVPTVLFPVRCSIQSLGNDFRIENRENLRATCQVNWYAVRDPERNLSAVENEETAGTGG